MASKVIEILLRDNLVPRAEALGELAQGMFRNVQATYPDRIVNVRGRGLMLGIELAFPGQEVWRKLLEAGFVLNLTQDRVLRLLPPLVITEADLRRFSLALGDVLDQVNG